MTYVAVSAFDTVKKKRVVIGGTDSPEILDRWRREDFPEQQPRYCSFEEHTCFDNFAHAIWVIEDGRSIEQARSELALRGY